VVLLGLGVLELVEDEDVDEVEMELVRGLFPDDEIEGRDDDEDDWESLLKISCRDA
jgi:hypothetical protein